MSAHDENMRILREIQEKTERIGKNLPSHTFIFFWIGVVPVAAVLAALIFFGG